MFLIALICHMKRYRKSLLTFDGLYYVNTDMKFSGYAAYDVQWIRIERKWYYRHILFDLINRMPIAELINEKEDSATTKNFIKKQHQSNRVHCNCNGFKTMDMIK